MGTDDPLAQEAERRCEISKSLTHRQGLDWWVLDFGKGIREVVRMPLAIRQQLDPNHKIIKGPYVHRDAARAAAYSPTRKGGAL